MYIGFTMLNSLHHIVREHTILPSFYLIISDSANNILNHLTNGPYLHVLSQFARAGVGTAALCDQFRFGTNALAGIARVSFLL